MALIRSVATLVIEAIAKDNPDMPFKPTVDNCIAYDLRYLDDTKATCKVKAIFGTGLRGRSQVVYNKLDVDILTQGIDREFPRTLGTNTWAFLPLINARYGLDLKPSEVINLPILDSGNTCRLTIRPESLIFCGTVDLQVRTPLPGIGEAVTQREITPDFNTWDFGSTIPGMFLTRGHDYSDISALLTTLNVGTPSAQVISNLATALRNIDTVPWGIVENTLYSLAGSEVLFNGSPAAMPEQYKGNNSEHFDRVLVLSPVGTTGLSAPLVVNYNLYSDLRS